MAPPVLVKRVEPVFLTELNRLAGEAKVPDQRSWSSGREPRLPHVLSTWGWLGERFRLCSMATGA